MTEIENAAALKESVSDSSTVATGQPNPEIDEWGLPVKRSESPRLLQRDTEGDGYVATQVKAIDRAEEDHVKSVTSTTPSKGKATLQVPHIDNRESDSEDDEFRDAQSRPGATTPMPPLEDHNEVPVGEGSEPSKEILKAPISKKDSSSAQDPPTREPVAQQAKTEHTHEEEHQKPDVSEEPDRPANVDEILPAFKGMSNNEAKEEASSKAKRASKHYSSGANAPSEWSHQQLAPQQEQEANTQEDEWQVMPAFAPYDIYDDDNKLIAREAAESDDEAATYSGLGGAGKGYTRVQDDEDAQSATSLDENTKYLFKEVNTTSAQDDEEQRDAVSQMQATKDLLTEGQRIAYVGMTRLTLSKMLKDAQRAEGISKGSKKDAALAAEAMLMWSQKMMVRLYAHMDISTPEQVMIEQLAEHGVVPDDLTPTLMQNARVKNPMAEDEDSGMKSSSPRHSLSKSVSGRSGSSISSSIHDEESVPAPPPYTEHEGEDLPEVRVPSQLPVTKNIDIDLRWTVLCDLFLTLIADSVYDARSRVLLEKVGEHMSVEWLEICRFEKRVTDALEMQQAAEKENWNEDEHKETRRKDALKKRYMMMGLATVGGGLVIGLSAGLLAPVIGAGLAAGFTTIGVAGTGGFLAGAGGAAIITSTAAASGGIIAVRAANRRTGAVKTFEYRPLHNNKRVNLIVTVSGWMTGKVDDVRLPYSTVDPIMGDIYSVLWEPEMLTSMGDTINILATEALTQGLQQVLGSTLLIGLMAALQLPVVLTKLAYLIDNPWTVSLDRANSAGLILADSLIDRNLGTRPITFVGYSLGSRVIFACLRELARKGAHGLVQNVYLFGSPIVAKRDEYLKARTVVAGRFVNGYSTNDWILGYLFRLTSGGISRVAGLAPVEGVPGLDNVDVTELVPGHMAYRTAMPRLLREVGWTVISDEFSEIEDPDPENHEQRQRELINEIEEARKEFEKKEKESKGKFGFFSLKKKKAVEKKEWETYQESKEDREVSPGPSKANDGVLFDVDAMRRELAAEHMEIRELESTLPPMKLNLSATPPRPTTIRETQSEDAKTLPISVGLRASPIQSPNPSQDSYELERHDTLSPYQHSYNRVHTTFDSSSHSPPRSVSPLTPRQGSPSPPTAEPSDRSAAVQRPELKSSMTMPSTFPVLSPVDLDHNAWADDDDEFREREMEMSFA